MITPDFIYSLPKNIGPKHRNVRIVIHPSNIHQNLVDLVCFCIQLGPPFMIRYQVSNLSLEVIVMKQMTGELNLAVTPFTERKRDNMSFP